MCDGAALPRRCFFSPVFGVVVAVNLAEPELLFARFQQGALTVGGARAEFELFVLDLVKAQMPEAGNSPWKGRAGLGD